MSDSPEHLHEPGHARDPAPSEPVASAAERYLVHLITTVGVARNQRLEIELKKAMGLSATAMRTLVWIDAWPEVTMTALAAGVFFDRTTLTRTIDAMVRAGLVRRSSDAGDRRKVTLSLTEAGRRACAEARAVIDAGADPIAGLLDPETVKALIPAMLKLHAGYVPDPQVRDVHRGKRMTPEDEAAE